MTRKCWIIPALVVILLLVTAQVRSAPAVPSAAAAPPTLGGCPVFPANNIWNVPIDTLPVAANSTAYINTSGATRHVRRLRGAAAVRGDARLGRAPARSPEHPADRERGFSPAIAADRPRRAATDRMRI